MSFLKFTDELEKAISTVCHVALQSKGLEVVQFVNFIAESLKEVVRDEVIANKVEVEEEVKDCE